MQQAGQKSAAVMKGFAGRDSQPMNLPQQGLGDGTVGQPLRVGMRLVQSSDVAEAARVRGAMVAARLANGPSRIPAPNGATFCFREPTAAAAAVRRSSSRQPRNAARVKAAGQQAAQISSLPLKSLPDGSAAGGDVQAATGAGGKAGKARSRKAGSHFFDEEAHESGSGAGDSGSSEGEDEGSDLEGFIDTDATPVRTRDSAADCADGRWAASLSARSLCVSKLLGRQSYITESNLSGSNTHQGVLHGMV